MRYQIENKNHSFLTSRVHGLSDIPHIHTHLELIYLCKGSSIAVLDNKEYRIAAGDVFLAFPNQIHYYYDESETEGYISIFALDLFAELKTLFETQVPVSPIVPCKEIAADLEMLFVNVLEKNSSESTLDHIGAKGYFLALLGEVLPHMQMIQAPTTSDSMKKLLSYCLKNFTEPITLDDLATNLYLNKYYISHIFKERLNMSFSDFINGLRVENACALLKKGVNITDIAFASGFSSVRTFNRAFVKHTGRIPRDYIKQKEISHN